MAEVRANLTPAKYDRPGPDTAEPNPITPSLLQAVPEVVTAAARRPWFLRIPWAQLLELALYAARFGGPTAAFSTLFIPFNKSLREQGTFPGQLPIDFLWHSDQRSLTLSYLARDGRRVTTVAELGEDGIFYNVDRQPIGRVLPDGSIMIDRDALLPKELRDQNEPNLCKKPEPDKKHRNLNGLLFENFMKALVNPGNPTPSGFGIRLFSPARGNYVYFDDCQRRSGVLFDYKSVTYARLFSLSFWESPMDQLIGQAKDQLDAARGGHIVWVFAEEAARDKVEETFNKVPELRGRIQLIYQPWRPGVRT
jgi:hypothetical protein